MKPKRKLSKIDFSNEGAHIALCHKDQGVANGADYALVLKAQNFSDEFIEKIQQVKVTMELPDFLSRFFNIWSGDADVLAYMMGYVEPVETQADEKLEAEEEFQDWIKSRVESFEIIKQLAETDKFAEVLSKLSEDEYLALLNDQALLEKAFTKLDKQKQEAIDKEKAAKAKPRLVKAKKESSDVADATKGDAPQIASGEKEGDNPVVKSKSKETLMSKTPDVKTVEQTVEVEMIEKAAFEQIQKQAQETQELLKSAMLELEVFKAEKQAMLAKARKQAVVDAVKAEDKADMLFKSIEGLSDEQFNTVVTVVKSLVEQVEKSTLFQETGVTAEVQDSKEAESAVARILKSQFAK